ncbi:MAG: PIN domain-containing protein [bacterium]|nr:PIN domain-containing protein [bacterium]
MAGELLLDTGALVSLLDRSQSRHQEFAQFFAAWTGPVVSTEAVLTESTHLLGRVHGGRSACLEFFLAGGATLIPSSLAALRRCQELLDRYADLPMDFADASLVVLAEELGTDLVCTTDLRDFHIYRAGGDRSFQVLPQAL